MSKSILYPGLSVLQENFDDIRAKLGAGSKLPELASEYKVTQKVMQYFLNVYVLPSA